MFVMDSKNTCMYSQAYIYIHAHLAYLNFLREEKVILNIFHLWK